MKPESKLVKKLAWARNYLAEHGGLVLSEQQEPIKAEREVLAEGWVLGMALDKYRDGYQHNFRINRHRPRIGHRRVAIVEVVE